MEVLKSGMRIAAVAAVIAGVCAPQPAMAARYEMVITCQSVWRPVEKQGGHFETVTALRKALECTAGLVAGWGAEPDSPSILIGPGPGITPHEGPDINCTNVQKERLRLQALLDTLREELEEMNDLLANAGDIHTAAQNETRRRQTELAIEQASCDVASNRAERLVRQAAAGRCNGREEVRERCIENLTRNTPSLATAQLEAVNACLFAEAVNQELTTARAVERAAGQTILSLWNRRDDTYREMVRTQVQLRRISDWQETCTGNASP